jgi:hypothetical protein
MMMKLPVTGLCAAFFFLLVSCMDSSVRNADYALLPQAAAMEMKGSSKLAVSDLLHWFAEDADLGSVPGIPEGLEATSDPSEAQLVLSVDPGLELKAEGYVLKITDTQVLIRGKDRAGLMYGLMTLGQLMADAEDQATKLPLCHIRDEPLLSYRAIHLDVKHHLEKKDYYYRLMDRLASYKINAIILEVEDKLAYERRPLVASGDAMSKEAWRKLSDYALERNIRISPLVQGLGHASFILKHEEYARLRDDPDSDWAFNPLDPETYELQFDLYLDALEAFPHGTYLHVGGDEVHTTGRGSGLPELALQLTWLNKVCAFAEEQGRTPIFWDDMPLKYAGLYQSMFNTRLSMQEVDSLWSAHESKLLGFLDQFPKNCIYMRWNYSSPQALGNTRAMRWFSDHGMQVMGATAGQTRWVLMPQQESNMENIRAFVESSVDQGIDGLLLTLWDDDSPHFELYQRGILAFAEYTWAGDVRKKEVIKSVYRQREYGHLLAGKEFDFVDRLEHMAGWWNGALMKQKRRVYLASMEDPLEEGIIDLPDPGNRGMWSEKHADRLEAAALVLEDGMEVEATIVEMKNLAGRNLYRLEVYEQVNRLIMFSARALLALQAYDLAGDDGQVGAMDMLRALPGEFLGLRAELEEVYGRTRILEKPEDYILDQDHHHHLANQSRNFDWFFVAELAFLEKLSALSGE